MMPNNRKGTFDVATLRSLVNVRDMKILGHIREHRFLTTKQIQRLQFWDHASQGAAIRACVRVLTRLRLRALIYKLERQIGGLHAGSGSYVWGIDDAGDRLLRAQPESLTAKRARTFEPTPLFLAHTLAIAETRVLLEEAAHEQQLELLSVTTEPSNWRTFIGRGGSPQVLKPDLHAITATGEFEDHWFIEIDNGTESLPTLLTKCLTYQRYFETGIEHAATGVFPAVVWIIADLRRRERLLGAIDAEHRLDERLFRVTNVAEFLDLTRERESDDEEEAVEVEPPGLAPSPALD